MRFIETDADLASLIDHLRTSTPLRLLGNIDAHEIFRHLAQLGYKIAKPATHPSGLKTCEEAITPVIPIGAAIPRATIDRRATRR